MDEPINNPMPSKTSGVAISSLVLGILSLTCFSIFAAIPGVICGHLALSRIKRSNDTIPGKGLAIAGLVTGYIGVFIAIFMIPLVLAIAVPNFVKARAQAQKNFCINNLRQIQEVKQDWARANNKSQTDVPTASDLTPYLKSGMPKCLAGGEYQINAVGEVPTCSIPGHKMPGDSSQ